MCRVIPEDMTDGYFISTFQCNVNHKNVHETILQVIGLPLG